MCNVLTPSIDPMSRTRSGLHGSASDLGRDPSPPVTAITVTSDNGAMTGLRRGPGCPPLTRVGTDPPLYQSSIRRQGDVSSASELQQLISLCVQCCKTKTAKQQSFLERLVFRLDPEVTVTMCHSSLRLQKVLPSCLLLPLPRPRHCLTVIAKTKVHMTQMPDLRQEKHQTYQTAEILSRAWIM